MKLRYLAAINLGARISDISKKGNATFGKVVILLIKIIGKVVSSIFYLPKKSYIFATF